LENLSCRQSGGVTTVIGSGRVARCHRTVVTRLT
jgi:hypothetical protein